MKYVTPTYLADSFTCPFCQVLTAMGWMEFDGHNGNTVSESQCYTCREIAIWRVMGKTPEEKLIGVLLKSPANCTGEMIYPRQSTAPMPSTDLPSDCMSDYMEAREILNASPRGAGALLRLLIQKLCVHFGEPGKNINDDIGSLVTKGKLKPEVQKAMDTLRIVGNNLVHAGELQMDDDVAMVGKMFELVNYIVYEMITRPNTHSAFFDMLPLQAKEAIERRDKPKS